MDTFSSNRDYQEAITTAMQRASQIAGVQLEPERVIFSDSNLPVPDQQQRLGNQDITIVTHPAPTITNLLNQMQHMQQQAATAIAPRLRNIAAQILLHAAGQAEFRGEAAACNYYRLLGTDHAGVRQISGQLRVQPTHFIAQAEAVIVRRNAATHPVTSAALDAEVAELQPVVTPALRQMCQWECEVVMHYKAFKEAFSDCFPAQPLE